MANSAIPVHNFGHTCKIMATPKFNSDPNTNHNLDTEPQRIPRPPHLATLLATNLTTLTPVLHHTWANNIGRK